MNRQNFQAEDRFPLSTQSLAFMQEMIMAVSQLTKIGGNNYILSGCETIGNKVTPGVIVINGEIMPFEGGSAVDTITIVETPVTISANGRTFENARITRTAKFASGPGENYFLWENFKPLQTNDKLEAVKATVEYVDNEIAKIQAQSIPNGLIAMWSGSVTDIPVGWQLCDGSPIGNTGKFTPNLSGRFIVGYSPEESLGYNIGRGAKNPDQCKVTLTTREMPRHNHGIGNGPGEVSAGAKGLIKRSTSGDKTPGGGDNAGAGTEMALYDVPSGIPYEGNGEAFDIRPPYYVLAFIIKIDVKI